MAAADFARWLSWEDLLQLRATSRLSDCHEGSVELARELQRRAHRLAALAQFFARRGDGHDGHAAGEEPDGDSSLGETGEASSSDS